MLDLKRKTIALLLCLVVLLTGCGKKDQENGLTGTWEATISVNVLGFDVDVINGQAKCLLELFEDGSCTYRLSGENIPEQTVTLRYQAKEGKITFLASNGGFAEWDCQLEEDTMTLTNGDWKTEFTRK